MKKEKRPRPFYVSVTQTHWEDTCRRAAEAEEMLDAAKRVQAEFIRYQERVKKQKKQQEKYMVEDLVKELLPSLDAFDRCLETIDSDEVAKGVELVKQEILRSLAKFGVSTIDAEDKPFDPRLHQAIEVVPTSDHPENMVLDVLKRGYLLHDRVVRPAMVRVSKKPPKKGTPGKGA